MKLEEVVLLFKLITGICSILGAVLGWLLYRMIRWTLWFAQKQTLLDNLERFRVRMEGDQTTQTPGVMIELEQARNAASSAAHEMNDLKHTLGLSDRNMLAIRREAIRRRIGIDQDPEPSDPDPPRPSPDPSHDPRRTGGGRASSPHDIASPLPPPAKRLQTPHPSRWRGKPGDGNENE